MSGRPEEHGASHTGAAVPLQHTVIRNTAWLTGAQLIGKGLTFVSFVLMARLLGDAQFGEMSFALSFAGIFLVFGFMGLDTVVIRDLAQGVDDADGFVSDVLSLRAALTLGALALTVAAAAVFGYPAQLVGVTALFGTAAFLDHYARVLFAVFRAWQRMRLEAVLTLVEKFLLFAGLIICAVTDAGLYAVGGIYITANAVKVLVALHAMHGRHARFRFRVRPAAWKGLLARSVPFAAVFVFWSISYRVDQVMLEHLRGVSEVGWYGAAYRLIETLTFLPEAVGSALMPAVASTVLIASERALHGVRQSLRFLLFLSVGIATAGSLFGGQVITPLLGPEFAASAPVFGILVWSLVCIFAEFVTSGALASAHAQKKLIMITATCMTVNIGLNLVLIPRYGMTGAAVSTILTEALNVTLALVFLSAILRSPILQWRWLAFAAAGAAMAATGWLLTPVHWVLGLAAGSVIYVLTARLLGGITGADAALLAAALRRRAVASPPGSPLTGSPPTGSPPTGSPPSGPSGTGAQS